MVTVTVWPGVKPVMLKEKNPCGKTRFGLPAIGRVPSQTGVRFSRMPALAVKEATPVPVQVDVDRAIACSVDPLAMLESPDQFGTSSAVLIAK